MTNTLPFQRDPNVRQIRLQTLIRLRWIAVAGQTITLLWVNDVLGFPVPIAACLAIVLCSACLNIVLTVRFPMTHRLSIRSAMAYLTYDVLQLAALLALTGGLTNPFAFLIVVPVLIAAGILPPRNTIMLGCVAVMPVTALAFWYQPLPWWPDQNFDLPRLYVAGVWVAIVSSVAFMSLYVWRVAEEARQLADALAATELVLTREQHLSAIDGLAAAAAHELGTPLGTIALVAKEIVRDTEAGTPLGDDVRLIQSEVARCRQILRKIGSLGDDPNDMLQDLPVTGLIEEIAAPHRNFGIEINLKGEGSGPEPIGRRSPGMLYGLGNLVENAVDFARSQALVRAAWTESDVVIEILDDGPGFSAEVFERLGEPFVTRRQSAGRSGRGPDDAGLGLGVFIAKTLLERSGARVSFDNRKKPASGARILVVWPRRSFETGTNPATFHMRNMGQMDTSPPLSDSEDRSRPGTAEPAL
ncbi:MAG: ActS/PrrB/RegB family redox-sensitive histidine kinase [Pseudomonadota bacterium]